MAVVKERCGGDLLKGLTGEPPGNGERVRHGWMMDGVKTEEVWLLCPLADGGAVYQRWAKREKAWLLSIICLRQA